jgi:hypothetical protein
MPSVINPKPRQLSDQDINKIINTIAPIYKTGQRHLTVLYLTGWLYKSNIDYDSAKRLILTICNKFQDLECPDRLRVLDSTYQSPKQNLKTKRGIFELLSKSLNNDQDIADKIRTLEEILDTDIINNNFYRYVTASWIKSNPKRFSDIVNRYNSYPWLQGYPVFSQTDYYSDKTNSYYDVYIKYKSQHKFYHLFINIYVNNNSQDLAKTIKREFNNIKNVNSKPIYDSYYLLFIAKSPVLQDIKNDPNVNSLLSDYVSVFGLEHIEPYIKRDLKSFVS